MLNINQLAASIGVSRATTYRLIKAGKLPKGIPVSPRRKIYRPEWSVQYLSKLENDAKHLSVE